MKRIIYLLLIIVICLNFTGCKNNKKAKEINIAIQYGLPYAPLEIMKENEILEKKLKGIKINYIKVSNTAAIREAMVSGNIDIGFMAIPPFLVGSDNGMKWKIISGLSSSESLLLTHKKEINSVKALGKNDKIALPQPGSVQHILLAMELDKLGLDPHSLDKNLLTLSHPDGMSLLLSKKDVTAHFTTPPYSTEELKDAGIHSVLTGKEAFGGDFTFIIGAVSEEYYNNNKETTEIVKNSIKEAIDYIYENKKSIAGSLGKSYNIPGSDIEEYLDKNYISYDTDVAGLERFSDFMEKYGFIKNKMNYKNLYIDEDKNEK
jgi:NitT/TauT family transport system substrate-binding protein